MGNFVNLNNVKLIIWDLDGTLWDGVLEEGEIKIRPEVMDFILKSVDRGIMHSVCSKNDFEKVRTTFYNYKLEKVWNCFLFPSINWYSKGERIREIINNMQLRAENTLFIDDNEINLNEAKFYCPEIMTLENPYEAIKNLYFVNSFDINCSRLKEYKILEKKAIAKSLENYSNEEFLKKSNIRICIKEVTPDVEPRIRELVRRTNQLNFTKNREPIFNNGNENKYVIVEDDFGNYGICGFYSLNRGKNLLEHYLFSCRVLGMGIEKYIYNKLQHPKINIIEPVSSTLDGEVGWISEVSDLDTKQKENKSDFNVLFKGPCDLLSAIDYIKTACNIDTEFPYYNEKFQYILEHTHIAYIVQAHRESPEKLREICNRFPFPFPENFKTEFFNPKYNIIFLSLLTSLHSGLYINNNDGTYVVFGFSNVDITNPDNWAKTLENIPKEFHEANLIQLSKFKNDYTFAGEIPQEEILKNLEYIKNNISSDTKLVLILGSEKDTSKTERGYENLAQRHAMINPIIEEFAKKNNIETINLTDFIESDEDYTTCINHFERHIYLKLANRCANIIQAELSSSRQP